MLRKLLPSLIVLLGLNLTLSAQTESAPWSIGLSFGKMEYNGSIGNNSIFKSPYNQQFGFRLSKYVSPLIDLSLGTSLGQQGLYDRVDAPNSFEGNTFQANLGFQLKPVASDKFQPFFSAAVGYFNYNDDSPGAVTAKGSNSDGLTIPLGVGIKYHISDDFGLFYHSQYSMEYTGSAYNGVDADSKDRYWLHELGLALSFGKEDRDGDRVADDRDKCPDTPGLRKMDGCPDTDLDGVIDSEDDCPEVAGLMEYNGCPDSDGDGIVDPKDDCPNVAGEARYNGCPDTDNDGIGDAADECPEEPGVARYNGCPIPDSDGDGFNDEDDECPQTKGDLRGCPDTDGDGFHDQEDNCVNVAGEVMGCPDRDSDGIADKDDKCPDEAGIAELDGCPEVPEPTREEIINSWRGKNIQFISGTRPDEHYDDNIAQIVEFHKEYPEAYIHLGGYSDSSGSKSSNMTVSKNRAKKVYKSLIAAGIPEDMITHEGYGESNPVADNDTREGRLMNRRVEVSASTVKRVIETNVKR